MALAYLFYMFISLGVISGILITLLFIVKNNKVKNITFYLLVLWSILICFISVTSLPSNYTVQRMIGYIIGFLALIGLYINLKLPNKVNLSYVLVSTSTIVGLLNLVIK